MADNNLIRFDATDLKIATDIAEIKSDIKYVRETLVHLREDNKDKEKRINSLEISRTWARAWASLGWTAIVLLSWDWIRALFKGL